MASMNTRRSSITDSQLGSQRMIDEARIVAVGAAIDDDAAIDDEQKGVVVARVLVLVAPIGLAVRDAIAEILDDARALADAAQREHAAAVQRASGAPAACLAAPISPRHGFSRACGRACRACSRCSYRHRRLDRRMELIVHELEVLVLRNRKCSPAGAGCAAAAAAMACARAAARPAPDDSDTGGSRRRSR